MRFLPKSNRSTLLLCIGGTCLIAACLAPTRPDLPPHSWWSELGPVVPHDSFPADCSICHLGEDWSSIKEDFHFDHSIETGIELVGAHESAACLRCHNDRGPIAVFASRGCAGCHQDVHRGQLGGTCESCHDQDSWMPTEVIAMHAQTRFPLSGAHAAVACYRCHEGASVGSFTFVDTACETCHVDDLSRADDPDHSMLGWVTDCDRCHSPTSFASSGFRHTTFPLTGAHTTTDCLECHTGGVYTGLSQACEDCHLSDFNSADDPDHVAGNFPRDCALCHSTFGWPGAGFNHVGISSGCVQCHLDDYQATTSPNHTTGSFSTACQDCHTTQMWQGAAFNHSLFDTSGRHNFRCSECHQVPSNFGIVSCIHCHDHRQSEMDDEHDDVNGYSWVSSACVSCHPTGSE